MYADYVETFISIFCDSSFFVVNWGVELRMVLFFMQGKMLKLSCNSIFPLCFLQFLQRTRSFYSYSNLLMTE